MTKQSAGSPFEPNLRPLRALIGPGVAAYLYAAQLIVMTLVAAYVGTFVALGKFQNHASFRESLFIALIAFLFCAGPIVFAGWRLWRRECMLARSYVQRWPSAANILSAIGLVGAVIFASTAFKSFVGSNAQVSYVFAEFLIGVAISHCAAGTQEILMLMADD